MARGRHSQDHPKLDIVAVMTGILKDNEYYPMAGLIDDIAGAIKSDTSLTPDSAAQSSLAASIQKTSLRASLSGRINAGIGEGYIGEILPAQRERSAWRRRSR
jgi:hypothetical protein